MMNIEMHAPLNKIKKRIHMPAPAHFNIKEKMLPRITSSRVALPGFMGENAERAQSCEQRRLYGDFASQIPDGVVWSKTIENGTAVGAGGFCFP